MTKLSTIHVPAGSFVVERQKPVIYQAYLNSCVGVALYDKENKIAGLIHLLLPEPPDKNTSYNIEKYASTGLPVFIEKLIAAGAQKEMLRASVAGGAFAGKISRQDLNLDIGGRTAEKVIEILDAEKIPVDFSETGGNFTCSIAIDMMSFTVTINPEHEVFSFQGVLVEKVSMPSVSELISAVQPIPQVALKLLRMINDDRSDFKAIAREVKMDQVIAANVLKQCNRAIKTSKLRIDSIEDAVVIIGQKALEKILLTTGVDKILSGTHQGYSSVKGELFHHSVKVAKVSEKLAMMTSGRLAFNAYAAGLLHDIGKVVLDQYVSKYKPMFYREIIRLDSNMYEAEKKILGLSHTEAGYQLALKWNLPESIFNSIKYHHQPDHEGQNSRVINIVALADALVHMYSAGCMIRKINADNLLKLIEINGYSILDFPTLIDLVE